MPTEARLFGTPHIVCNGRRIDPKLSTQTLILAAMLLVRGGQLSSRREIAFSLWPDLGEAEALASLRRHVYLLQRALPPSERPWIVADARSIAWGQHDETSVDVREFQRFNGQGDALDEASALYCGDFLMYVDHEWVAEMREQLRRDFTRGVEKAIRVHLAHDDLAGAFDLMERLLQHDPWREDVMRDFMLLRAQRGDRAGALFAYRNFSRRLREELDVEPMPETERCYQDIAQGRIAFASSQLSA